MPSDGELRAMLRLARSDAHRMFKEGRGHRHRYFVELYRVAARGGYTIPLKQLQFCYTRPQP
jgi:hypothetical protein